MERRLLDRQVRLLDYLTGGDAIFRDKRNTPLDPLLRGIDRGLLDVEARFSHEKRMEKIAAVFKITFALLGAEEHAIVREFVDACPPVHIGRIENACQFHDFLCDRWKREAPVPAYLPDVAACELACALVRTKDELEAASADAPHPGIRRSAGVVLLRTAFDIRAIFEGDSAPPTERESTLAVALKSGEPQIFELTTEVFDFLAALDQWVALDELPDADSLIADLAESGLLELRR